MSQNLEWYHIVLGDFPDFSLPLREVWAIFRITILFDLWKEHNRTIFDHLEPSIVFSFNDKLIIFVDAWLQICVQVDKVQMELNHLHNLLEFWDNASCVVSLVSLELSHRTRSRSQSHSYH